jgi:hypothetical protein
MQLFWSWRKVPELSRSSRNEYRQTIGQVGLKPYRHWQVLVTILGIGFLTLFLIDAEVGSVYFSPNEVRSNYIFLSLFIFIIFATLVFRHIYFTNLRPYIQQITFDPASTGWRAFLKAVRTRLISNIIFLVIFLVAMLGIDWTINCFDESPDPRIATLKNWPDPIPDSENGFVAMQGFYAPLEVNPFEAGRTYILAYNDTIAKNTKQFPKSPSGLKYVAYTGYNDSSQNHDNNGKPLKKSGNADFCNMNFESCWNILRNEHAETIKWLSANNTFLSRYQNLQKYPRWQYTLSKEGGFESPLPAYQQLIQGQKLLLAAAMLEIEKGHVEQGLEMVGENIQFSKEILGAKESLIGKMIGTAMLTRDIAWVTETLQAKKKEVKPYLTKIENMLHPMTPVEISVADGFRFEEQLTISIFDRDDFDAQKYTDLMSFDETEKSKYIWDRIAAIWLWHDTKRYATANMELQFWEKVIKLCDVKDVTSTPLVTAANTSAIIDSDFKWLGAMHNTGGNFMVHGAIPAYQDYQNKIFDLNTLNNLVRLQVIIAEKGLPPAEVPKFLVSSDHSLWNPEISKPFQWDEKQNQIYFVPSIINNNRRIGGVDGRVGVSLL